MVATSDEAVQRCKMDRLNYESMLRAFNNVLESNSDDMFIDDVNTLKSIFIDFYGDEE